MHFLVCDNLDSWQCLRLFGLHDLSPGRKLMCCCQDFVTELAGGVRNAQARIQDNAGQVNDEATLMQVRSAAPVFDSSLQYSTAQDLYPVAHRSTPQRTAYAPQHIACTSQRHCITPQRHCLTPQLVKYCACHARLACELISVRSWLPRSN